MANMIRVDDFVEEFDAIHINDPEAWQLIDRSGSGSSLSVKGMVYNPFEHEGEQFVSMSRSSIPRRDGGRYDVCYAYQIVPRADFKDEVYGKYGRPNFTEGFYHRRYAYLNGEMHVLLGPELAFVHITKPKGEIANG